MSKTNNMKKDELTETLRQLNDALDRLENALKMLVKKLTDFDPKAKNKGLFPSIAEASHYPEKSKEDDEK